MAGTRAKDATGGNGPSYPPAVAEMADTPLAAMTAGCDERLPPQSAASAPEIERALAPADQKAAPASSASLAGAATASTSPAGAREVSRRVTLDGKAMGTHLEIVTFTTDALDEAAIRPKLELALAEIRRVEALMTTWRDEIGRAHV